MVSNLTLPSTNQNTQKQTKRKTAALKIDQSILESATIHTNLTQEVIVTTQDKLNLALINHQNIIKARTDWVIPFSILLSAITSLVAADFKTFLSIPADSWKSLYILASVISFVWLLYCLYKLIINRNKGNNDYFINSLKKDDSE